MAKNPNIKPDPFTVEVIANALNAIAEEITINLARTAHNTIVYEVQDFCTGLLSADARLIAQAPGGLPLFVGDLDAAVRDGLAMHGVVGIAAGDVLLTNHTGTCGQHLNNVVVYTPIFYQQRLFGFAATRAHWADVGSRIPGGFLTDAVSSFEEGIQLRSIRLYRAGKPDSDLMRVLQHNIRNVDASMGDLHAQIGACRMAEKRLTDLLDTYTPEVVIAAIGEIWDQSERRVRQRIAQWPDGTYRAKTFLDNDGIELDKPVAVAATVIVKGDRLTIDLSDMSPQVRGPINAGRAAGVSAARLALKYLAASDLNTNEGCFRPLDVVLPEGTLISAAEPAAMSWWQTPMLTLIDTIFQALAPAFPQAIPAGHYSDISTILLTGKDPRTNRDFVNIEPVAGGWGARAYGDGPSGTYTLGHGDTYNIPIEVLEARYPLRVKSYGYRTDSGGVGEFRGGLGLRRVYEVMGEARFNGLSERSVCPPWGLSGGKPAYSGAIHVTHQGNRTAYSKVTGLVLQPGDELSFETGGGGGHGNPLSRAPEAVRADVLGGKVSSKAARELYGVVLCDEPELSVDAAATVALRARVTD
jgi:N-methylhydantoinase B